MILFFGSISAAGATRSASSRSPIGWRSSRGTTDGGHDRWVQRYAARLEGICRAHPYNWFNFYDFWGGGVMLRWPASTGLLLATALAGAGLGPPPALRGRARRADVGAVQRSGRYRSNFREEKELAALTAPLLSSGTLAYSARTISRSAPASRSRKQITVDGDWLTYAKPADDIHYTMTLTRRPSCAAWSRRFVAHWPATSAALRRYYTVSLRGHGRCLAADPRAGGQPGRALS